MKPFRMLGKFIRWFITGVKHWITFSPTSRPRRVMYAFLNSLKYKISKKQKLKYIIRNILAKFPYIEEKIFSLLNPSSNINPKSHISMGNDSFFLHIKNEVENRKKMFKRN